MSSFVLYMCGMGLVIGGLAYGAWLGGLATQWIVVGAVVLFGLGMLGAVKHTRPGGRRD
ncbi:MAG: hypothetical protein U0S76_01800 [Pseudoxanthomonas sp.]|nr:hypothetical protein [Pseudoxanthomonas sp.]